MAKYLNVSSDLLIQVKHIHNLMPSFISTIHNSILDAYIQRGTTALNFNPAYVYLSNPNGFLELTQFHLIN